MEDSMRTNPCLIGLVVACSLAAGASANAQRLKYTGQTDVNLTVDYFNLPASTQLFYLNKVTGGTHAALVPLVSGSGSMAIPMPAGPADYYIQAEQGGQIVARTVMFYAPDPSP
jgi:hypothetical protein